ncbi:MAG: DUF2924 domain-containing protein [Candidatus Omnitrophota bacterium]|jgi:hypothetical protein
MSEIMALKNASADELLKRYKELYSEGAASNHRLYLWRKVAYKLQEREYGGFSAKAKGRLKALIEGYDPINFRQPARIRGKLHYQPKIRRLGSSARTI